MFVSTEEFKRAKKKDGLAVYKDFAIEDVKEVEDLVLEFVISTDSVDRDADRINPNGWKLDAYNKNPVVLFAHDYNNPPVATALATWVEDGKLKSRAKFTPKEIYPFGYMIYQMYKNGFMKGTSVGFNPIKWKYSEEREAGIDFEEQELLEWSCVPVPANPEALIAASAKGIDTKLLKQWAEKILEATKGAISYNQAHPNGTPKAAEDAEWDGAAEVAAADVEDLKVMCAWVNSENPDIKGSYKLPHHRAGGDHPVVWRGVAAAMAALMGARGGVDIPEADKRGVYNHLAKHYEEFEKTPPEFSETVPEEVKGGEVMDKRVGGEVEQVMGESEEVKVGAVLNKRNKEKLEQARDLIQEVLETAEPAAEEQDSIDIEEIKQMVMDALQREIKQLQGKLD